MSEPSPVSKWAVPRGSLVVDTALVVMLLWGQASITETLKSLSDRVTKIEQTDTDVGADRRIGVLEKENQLQDRDILSVREEISALRRDLMARFDRQDEKLDRVLEKDR